MIVVRCAKCQRLVDYIEVVPDQLGDVNVIIHCHGETESENLSRYDYKLHHSIIRLSAFEEHQDGFPAKALGPPTQGD